MITPAAIERRHNRKHKAAQMYIAILRFRPQQTNRNMCIDPPNCFPFSISDKIKGQTECYTGSSALLIEQK